jgi:hypothetical protein
MMKHKIISIILLVCFFAVLAPCDNGGCIKLDVQKQNSFPIDLLLVSQEMADSFSFDFHDNCQCFCHVTSIEYKMAVLSHLIPEKTIFVCFSFSVVSAPSRTVFRPPLAV